MSEYGGNRKLIMDDVPAVGGHRHGVDVTRQTLGFPLGTALILLIVFGISALFSCCYHWEKIRNMHSRHSSRINTMSSSSADANSRGLSANSGATSLSSVSVSSKSSHKEQSRSSVPVMMPGEDVPRFIARPSPHGFVIQSGGFGDKLPSSEDAHQCKITTSNGHSP